MNRSGVTSEIRSFNSTVWIGLRIDYLNYSKASCKSRRDRKLVLRNWQQIKRLVFNSATLSRVLSEMELDRISESLQDLSFSNVLVVGSGKRLKGSELVLLRPLNKSTRIIFADRNRFA